jgi:hypothetical protein
MIFLGNNQKNEVEIKAIKNKIDSTNIANISKAQECNFFAEKKYLNQLNIKLSELCKINKLKELELRKKQDEINEHLLLNKYIESLRIDFSSIQPNQKNSKDKEYMKVYRKYEQTLILATCLAKKLKVYNEYEEFLNQRFFYSTEVSVN